MNRQAFLSAIILWAAVGALVRRADAAGPFHAGEAIPALAQRLFDGDPAVRQAAVLALGAMGPEAKAAIPALAQRLGDPDRYIASDASIVLKTMGRRPCRAWCKCCTSKTPIPVNSPCGLCA